MLRPTNAFPTTKNCDTPVLEFRSLLVGQERPLLSPSCDPALLSPATLLRAAAAKHFLCASSGISLEL